MNKSTYLRIVSLSLIISLFCIPLSGCHATKKFNWTMYGALIDSNGQISERVQFTAEGTLKDYAKKADELNLQVLTPDHIPYMLPNPDNADTDGIGISLPYFASLGYGYDKIKNEPVFSAFALDVQQEYVIFQWDGSGNTYLIGCTNPDADLTAVFAHFQAFVEHCSIYIKP